MSNQQSMTTSMNWSHADGGATILQQTVSGRGATSEAAVLFGATLDMTCGDEPDDMSPEEQEILEGFDALMAPVLEDCLRAHASTGSYAVHSLTIVMDGDGTWTSAQSGTLATDESLGLFLQRCIPEIKRKLDKMSKGTNTGSTAPRKKTKKKPSTGDTTATDTQEPLADN